jgi:acetyltransferase-like isoleucine patch superfamily enzyme
VRGFFLYFSAIVEGTVFVDRGVKVRSRFRHQIRLESNVHLEQFVELNALPSKGYGSGIHLQWNTEVGAFTIIMSHGGHVSVGRDVHIGPRSQIQGRGGVSIGDGTIMGPGCILIASNHTRAIEDMKNTGDRLYNDEYGTGITIGSQCWFGADVVILDGVSIGDRTVIGASSVVTRSMPSDVLVLGNPAKVRKKWDYGSSGWVDVIDGSEHMTMDRDDSLLANTIGRKDSLRSEPNGAEE